MRLAFSLSILILLTACNTMEGIGRDIGSAGNAISGTASQTKQNM